MNNFKRLIEDLTDKEWKKQVWKHNTTKKKEKLNYWKKALKLMKKNKFSDVDIETVKQEIKNIKMGLGGDVNIDVHKNWLKSFDINF